MKARVLATALLITPLVTEAYADQCQVVDLSQALSVLNLLKIGGTVGSLCEPCGEEVSEAGGPYFEAIRSLEIREFSSGEAGQYEVYINGKSADLAYTYVTTGQSDTVTVSVNAAYLVGCPASAVTTRFLVD